MTTPITSIRHPGYTAKQGDWIKWRYVYEGSEEYVKRYLKKYSDREQIFDFERRREITPTPNFAKAAINDVKNSIFQRLTDVNRRDGSKTYQRAVLGEDNGVDLHGSSMNGYIGRELLIEMLVMSKVGVFVDMPQVGGRTLRDAIGVQPYLYKYRAEDILSWSFRPGRFDEFNNLLLRDHVEIYNAHAGLPSGVVERYRHVFIDPEDGLVHIRFYEQRPGESKTEHGTVDFVSVQVDVHGKNTTEDIILNMPVIPFVLIDIQDSLLCDVANHQIALLNLESSDISYALKSNYPFYTEQQDVRPNSAHLAPTASPNSDGTAAQADNTGKQEIVSGATQGRRYGKGLERPGFIHPSSEPLKASMAKQQALKEDIRALINLSLSNIKPARLASAESKKMDQTGLEAGLSNIGLVLEHSERKIAKYWHMLENSKQVASIKYPEKWSLKSDAERREDAKSLRELRDTIPSTRFQKSISQEIARLLLNSKVSNQDMDDILEEIETANSHSADPKTIFDAVDRGILDLKSAAKILGWPETVVEKAAKDHADRLSRIAISQSQGSGARGVDDLDGNPRQTAREEKVESKDTTTSDDTSSRVRGNQQPKPEL